MHLDQAVCLWHSITVTALTLPYRYIIKVLLKQQCQLWLQILLLKVVQLFVSSQHIERSPLCEHSQHLTHWSRKHYKLVLNVQHCHHVLLHIPLTTVNKPTEWQHVNTITSTVKYQYNATVTQCHESLWTVIPFIYYFWFTTPLT